MGRLAATEFGADWVIHSDADEFWWPRGESLKDVLDVDSDPLRRSSAPCSRHFVPRPDDESSFAERMTVRMSSCRADQRSAQSLPAEPEDHPSRRSERERVDRCATADRLDARALCAGWYPIEFFHFPVRSLEQCERKYATSKVGSPGQDRPRARTTTAFATLIAEGRLEELYDSLVVDDGRSRAWPCEEGSLVIDDRLRDALRCGTWERGGAHVSTADGCRRGRLRGRRGGAGRSRRRPSAEAAGHARAAPAHGRAATAPAHRPEVARRREEAAPPQLRSGMRLVLTVLARDEVDVIDAQLAFHLNAGVDLRRRDGQQLAGRDDGDPRGVRARRASSI